MAAHLHLAPSPTEIGPASGATSPIQVALADGHALMRNGLRQLLEGEQDIAVIAEAQDLTTAASHVHSHSPRVLVLDLNMPGGSGLEVIGQLCERVPETRIVVITMNDTALFAQRALAAGAVGIVLKNRADSELADAVRAAARDEEYISPQVASRLQALRHSITDGKLSVREVEVLRLIALGYTSVEIARKLGLSTRTVEIHRAHIHDKLGLRTRSELVRYALRRGLLRA